MRGRLSKLLTICALSLSAAPATLFEGERLIVDARRTPIENAALLIDNGRVAAVGKKGSVKAPAGALRVNLTGKTVIPALVDVHVHLGYQKGLVYSVENFNRDNLIDQLNRYAYCGVAAVLSLGTDLGDLPFELRSEQDAGKLGGALYRTAGHGFAAPNAGPGTPELKAAAYGVTTEQEARKLVRDETARHVDFIKIWVDDRNGTVQKLRPDLYRAIIDEAHKHGTRVIAHVYYLDDAKDLARAGIDAFAHLVRDREMDDEVVGLIKQHDILVMPNIAISENGAHGEPPVWLNDPLLHEVAPEAVIERVRASYARRSTDGVARAQKVYRDMQRSLAKLNSAGVRIALGTDDGAVRDHFYAYTALRELQLMVDGGMSPQQTLTAATVTSAEFLRLKDYGTLEAGKSASFIVLDANPLDDIGNAKKISNVYLRGQEVDRQALRAQWR